MFIFLLATLVDQLGHVRGKFAAAERPVRIEAAQQLDEIVRYLHVGALSGVASDRRIVNHLDATTLFGGLLKLRTDAGHVHVPDVDRAAVPGRQVVIVAHPELILLMEFLPHPGVRRRDLHVIGVGHLARHGHQIALGEHTAGVNALLHALRLADHGIVTRGLFDGIVRLRGIRRRRLFRLGVQDLLVGLVLPLRHIDLRVEHLGRHFHDRVRIDIDVQALDLVVRQAVHRLVIRHSLSACHSLVHALLEHQREIGLVLLDVEIFRRRQARDRLQRVLLAWICDRVLEQAPAHGQRRLVPVPDRKVAGTEHDRVARRDLRKVVVRDHGPLHRAHGIADLCFVSRHLDDGPDVLRDRFAVLVGHVHGSRHFGQRFDHSVVGGFQKDNV